MRFLRIQITPLHRLERNIWAFEYVSSIKQNENVRKKDLQAKVAKQLNHYQWAYNQLAENDSLHECVELIWKHCSVGIKLLKPKWNTKAFLCPFLTSLEFSGHHRTQEHVFSGSIKWVDALMAIANLYQSHKNSSNCVKKDTIWSFHSEQACGMFLEYI